MTTQLMEAPKSTATTGAIVTYAIFELNPDAEGTPSDRATWHNIAVQCAGTPGLDQPVRWALRDNTLKIRTTPGVVSGVPDGWRHLLGKPTLSTVKLRPGDAVQLELLAVPTKSYPNKYRDLLAPDAKRERRGFPVPITRDDDIARWLEEHLTPAFSVDDFSFRKTKIVSLALGNAWYAIDVSAKAAVRSAELAARLAVGRSKAYGFGLPVIEKRD